VKIGLLLVLTLALGALSANYLLVDNGYVLINFRGYAIEMSVPVLVFLLIVIYLVVRAGVRVWHAPRQLGEIAARRRARKAGDRIVRGYIEMGEGNFARGEKLLTKGVRNSETPLLNYLAAARAAQAQGDRSRRDNWLKMAYDQEPRAAATVLLTQAELQLANEEVEQARATLNKVLEMTPHNQQALRLMAELCLANNDWVELQELLPKLAKNNQIHAELLDSWYERTWCALLNAADNDPERVRKLWKQLPRHLRENSLLMSARIKALIAEGQSDEAESIIRKALNREWSEELIRLYADLEATDQAKLLHRAEAWLQTRSEDAALLLVAGRLCVRNELWGKARSYFESSIAIRPSPEAWHELGQLLIRMDEADAASAAFQKGLTLSYGGADVPRIAADMADD
jgi:HemY protein